MKKKHDYVIRIYLDGLTWFFKKGDSKEEIEKYLLTDAFQKKLMLKIYQSIRAGRAEFTPDMNMQMEVEEIDNE